MNNRSVRHELSPPRADATDLSIQPVEEAHRSWSQWLSWLASSLLLGGFWLYKRFISPPLHFLAGPQSGCRFHPSCSAYGADAVRVHGPILGVWLALRRIVRCNPLNPGGVDFVPPRHALRPRCVRTT